jgi:hypothetical protein
LLQQVGYDFSLLRVGMLMIVLDIYTAQIGLIEFFPPPLLVYLIAFVAANEVRDTDELYPRAKS